ncbi:MAG: hypothetical protein WBV71_08505, partial [Roseobacter sp.]
AKADALRQMAYVSTGANDRAQLMSQALALEGKVTLPRIIPPAPRLSPRRRRPMLIISACALTLN